LEKTLQDVFGENLMYGPFAHAANIDLSSRLSSRFVPQQISQMMMGQGDATQLAAQLLGPTGAMLTSAQQAAKMFMQARDLEAAIALMPTASKDVMKSLFTMGADGAGVLNSNGKLVTAPQDITTRMRMARAMGFTSWEEAAKMREMYRINQIGIEARGKGERLKNQYINAVADAKRAEIRGDPQAQERALDESRKILSTIQAYNDATADNAEKITLNLATVKRGVLEQIEPNANIRSVPQKAREKALELKKQGAQ
jgi:hypothetical protein